MKDFRFRNQSGTINCTFRTDMIGSTDRNFTIMSISGLSDFDTTNTYKEKKLINAFKKLASNRQAFVAFAINNDLQLVQMDVDGSNQVVLAVMRDESSYSESNSF